MPNGGKPSVRMKNATFDEAYVNNVAHMQYGTFRRQGFFIGSGVIEAGCKTVIGPRCKQFGNVLE